MMTVLADGLGVISVSAYGVRSKKSKTRVRLFSCCDFVLNKKNGDVYRMEQMDLVDGFYPVCEDVTKLSLASYFCDLAKDAFETSDSNVLSLLLNSIYFLSYKESDIALIKAAFEIKLSQYMGYEPQVEVCDTCGKRENIIAFDFDGGVKCKNCATGKDFTLSKGTHGALEHILKNTNIFSFSVSDAVKKELSDLAERYIIEKTERRYKSLEYLKNIM